MEYSTPFVHILQCAMIVANIRVLQQLHRFWQIVSLYTCKWPRINVHYEICTDRLLHSLQFTVSCWTPPFHNIPTRTWFSHGGKNSSSSLGKISSLSTAHIDQNIDTTICNVKKMIRNELFGEDYVQQSIQIVKDIKLSLSRCCSRFQYIRIILPNEATHLQATVVKLISRISSITTAQFISHTLLPSFHLTHNILESFSCTSRYKLTNHISKGFSGGSDLKLHLINYNLLSSISKLVLSLPIFFYFS